MITLTDKTKNAVSLADKDKAHDSTWDEAEMSWDDNPDSWDNPTTILINKDNNSVILTDKPKV